MAESSEQGSVNSTDNQNEEQVRAQRDTGSNDVAIPGSRRFTIRGSRSLRDLIAPRGEIDTLDLDGFVQDQLDEVLRGLRGSSESTSGPDPHGRATHDTSASGTPERPHASRGRHRERRKVW